jgi:hypothetical protein
VDSRETLAAHLKQFGKMARYCGDAELTDDCRRLFYELRDAKVATVEHERRAANLADRARHRLAQQDVVSTIGGRPVWSES